MTSPGQRPDATVDLSAENRLDVLASHYEAAWALALAGDAPPLQAAYVEGLSAADADELRRRLDDLDNTFRPRLSTPAHPGSTMDMALADQRPDGRFADTAEQIPAPAAHDATLDWGTARKTNGRPAVGPAGPRDGALAGYEILGELGRGGMGVVYKARQRGLNRLVALKMLLAGGHADDHARGRFSTEAEAVAKLQHPNIVQIYEVGEEAGLPFFSLEFVDGCSLAQKLGGNPQPPRDAARLIMVLARAMQYAHEHGIVHRDLKPANVLLTAGGVPKIADFGLAKQVEADSSQTKSGTLMGTPSYMAPEQARGDVHEIGPPADVHALGAILYELLVGRPPFVSANMMDTIMQVIRAEPVPPGQLRPGVPRDLETICLRCLQKEAHKRYRTAGELADDLDRFQAGEPIQARPIGNVERLWRWCRRNPRVAYLAASTFLLLVAGIIGSLVSAITIAQERNQKELERLAAESSRELAEERKVEADRANEQAQKNADEAKQNADEAKKNAAEATKQGNLALGALRTLIGEVQKQIGDSPDTQNLKLKLLETALEGLDKVAKSDENARLLGQSMAGTYMNLGQLFQQLGQSEKAYAQYAKCHEIIQALAARDPEGDVAQSNLAATNFVLGDMSQELRRDLKASLEYYQKSLAIRRALMGRKLSDKLNPMRLRAELAETHTRVGLIYLRLGEPQLARPSFQEALSLRIELAAANPTDFGLQLGVARSHSALGEVEFRTRNWPEARQQFSEALALCTKTADGNPTNPKCQWELANSLGNFGMFDVRTGDLTAAAGHYEPYLALMRKVVEVDPKNGFYKRTLGLAYYRTATLARRRGDVESARGANDACLAIREQITTADPKNERRLIEYLLVLPRCGQHAKAAELATKLKSAPHVDREVLVELAQCFAQCAVSVPGQPDLARTYTDTALAALDEAVGKGFKDLVLLETEPDLDGLRTHAGFTALLARLQQGQDAGATP